MASTMRSSTTEMVERKVLEMAQHASFHQHVSYNLSTILHAFTAGKTDPTEIAEAFSRARGLEVITRVVSGEPLAKPPVISLCCQVGRHVVEKFGPGVSQKQAGGLIEALVARLALGISGDVTQTVECQVEVARLMSSVAGQAASLLIDSGALGTVEGMLEQLGGNHSSIMRPCCEALERVSRTEEGREAFEERGTGGVLLATIRDFPEALEEGSDAALASALKVVERIFTGKTPEACALSLRAKTEEESVDDPHRPTFSDYDNCVETVLRVVEATPEAPGAAAAACLWWLSGASGKAPDRALSAILAAGEEALAAAASGVEDEEEKQGGAEKDEGRRESGQSSLALDVWSWFPRGSGGEDEEDEEGEVLPARPVEGARFLAALCLYKPGIQCLEAAVERESPERVAEALVALCESADPLLARACFRIIERLAKVGTGPQVFVEAGALVAAIDAGIRFEVEEDAETVEDAEARAIAAALGTVATLAEAGGKDARPVVDEAFRLSVRCLGRVGEFSGRPAAAAAKSALDVITVRLTRADRPKGAPVGRVVGASGTSGGADHDKDDGDTGESESGSAEDGDGGVGDDFAEDDVDAPMAILKDAGAILAVMKAHSADARVQQSGWRSLIAMDTGRGDVEKFWTGVGDGEQSRRQMLRDCLERHGGDSLVAGQVADILEELVLQGDSDGEVSTLTASLSDTPGEESPRLPACIEDVDGTTHTGEDGALSGDGSSPTPGGHSGDTNNSAGDDDDEGFPVSSIDALEEGAGDAALNSLGDGVDPAPEDAHPQEAPMVLEEGGGEGGPEVTGGEGGVAVGTEGSSQEPGSGGGDESETAAGDDPVGRGLPDKIQDESEEERSPEDVLVELSLAGTTALEGGSFSSTVASGASDSVDVLAGDKAADAADESSSSDDRRSVARSLFSAAKDKVGGNGEGAEKGPAEGEALFDDEAGTLDERPVVPSKEELKLRKSWTKLETLHSDIVGRSHILGGESAQMVAAIPEPSVLKKRVGTLLEEAEGGDTRDAFAAASLALVGALTAATGALANSQKEVQRYLAMSRDLRETSTWKDISDAMQWTMDSLKGTVILFTPHTAGGLTKALGLCKNMEAASKLFKEAALQIKIIVVQLAGEHEPNTVWRVNPMAFEALPENRKVMMLKHLRSLVVAYDHLSDEMRRDLTTALEIIKNREVLNMMGKYCIQSEAAEEKRRQAKLASAEERLKVGTRRPSATRQSTASGRRSPPIGIRSSITEGNTPPPPPNGPANINGSPATPQALTPVRGAGSTDSPGSASAKSKSKRGGRVSPPLSSNLGDGGGGRKGPLSTPRSTRSTESNSSGNSNNNAKNDGTLTGGDVGGVGGGTSGSRIPRSVMYHSRRRDTVAAAQGTPGSSALRVRRSKSPVANRRPGGRSKSPAPSRGGVRRASRSPLPRSKNVG